MKPKRVLPDESALTDPMLSMESNGVNELDLVDDTAPICDSEAEPWCAPGKDLLPNEVPFRWDVNLWRPSLIEERLGLSPVLKQVRDARSALIANAIHALARSPDTWVFYSRDRNHYAQQARRYRPSHYTLAAMTNAVASLEAANLVEHRITRPSPRATRRSTIRATARLRKLLDGLGPDLIIAPKEVIILRGADKEPCDYRDSKRRCAMREDVIAHNEFLARVDIHLDHPDAPYEEWGFLRVRGTWLDPRRRAYHRVFNGRWNQGGRWYGPYWQSLPGDVRRGLRINGEGTVERDYRACHLRLLCAASRISLPFDDDGYDPFKVVGIDRKKFKLAFNVMLNADSASSARGAIADELTEKAVTSPIAEAAQLIKAVRSHFPGLAPYWCTGAGLRLQNIDADICARVQRRLRGQNIFALSIHDSFIVPVRNQDVLDDVMAEEMDRACETLAADGLSLAQ